jgi:riboflavin kinase / FMN adenylyltransferase
MPFIPDHNCEFDHPFITMGTFDGVHLGHQKLLKELINRAKIADKQTVVISYYHHPLETIYKNTFPYLLTETKNREKMLLSLGIDCLLYLNFTRDIAEMSPDDFLKEVIYKKLQPQEIVVGYDTHFGKNRSGDFEFLRKHQNRYGYVVDMVEPYRLNGKIVSSSWCRECIRAGAVDTVKQLLGRSYSLSGKVIVGHRIGHQLGFPTANLAWEDYNKLLPKNGIYLSKVKLNGIIHWGLTNIGYRPTVIDKSDLTVETHILDFDKDIYGQNITITFEYRMRDEYKLHDSQELVNYIQADILEARKIIDEKENTDVFL